MGTAVPWAPRAISVGAAQRDLVAGPAGHPEALWASRPESPGDWPLLRGEPSLSARVGDGYCTMRGLALCSLGTMLREEIGRAHV